METEVGNLSWKAPPQLPPPGVVLLNAIELKTSLTFQLIEKECGKPSQFSETTPGGGSCGGAFQLWLETALALTNKKWPFSPSMLQPQKDRNTYRIIFQVHIMTDLASETTIHSWTRRGTCVHDVDRERTKPQRSRLPPTPFSCRLLAMFI